MAVESMRTEGEAVYEVRAAVADPAGRLWFRVIRARAQPGQRGHEVTIGPGVPEVAGMHAEGRELGTRMRVKTTTVAKIEKPKKAKDT